MTPQLRAQREIRKIRREMRLSQKAFAELMGVSTQTIWMWECGKKNPLFQKGSMLYIEGSLRTNKWQDKDTGQNRYKTEIIVKDMQMLDSKKDNSGQQSLESGSVDGSIHIKNATDNFMDDDIPF